jgi:GTP pyrophosphokinase/guanosine-3',5'-bis(diphosphate) 3'-pyrophosphohydrolase
VNAITQTKTKAGSGFLRQWELVDRVRAYDPSVNEALLNKAYVFSVQAHGDQMRHSGDPYYAHPIEVAGVLASLHLDVASVCTALLHDVLEDTDTTYDELAEEFTPEIAELVQGVTKLGQLELSTPTASRERQQAENFQKFVLAMSKDVRVLLVKLCDRLHNMRTLEFHPKPERREAIARETLEIYAPLARRIGVDRICSELEDLSFKFINPGAYESITKRLESWREDSRGLIAQVSVALRDLMDKNSIVARIYGREKRAYAIWRKLQKQGIDFEDVADIHAFRLIVPNAQTCYQVLGILHTEFRFVPARFRDFISVPKPNGYQSLHTTVLGPENRRVEIQIRTERMEDVAERGVAAHWAYKNEAYGYDPESAKAAGGDPLRRIRPLVEMLEHAPDADEFLENAKLEMFQDQVFTFTPRGDLIALPKGATPLDFAYAVHTDVGDSTIGAVINGRERPLRTPLVNGDVVRIIRGGAPELQPGWETLVVTGRARSALKRLAKLGEQEEFVRLGESLARQAMGQQGKPLTDGIMTGVIKRLGADSFESVYEKLGRSELRTKEFIEAALPGFFADGDFREGRDLIQDENAKLYLKGEGLREGVTLHLAECCSPISGDRIMGVQRTRGVEVHTIDCEQLVDFDDRDWIDLAWRRSAEQSLSTARISATVQHTPGALADVTKLIGEAKGNLINIKTVRRSDTFFDMILDIEVDDNRHLSHIIAAVRASSFVVHADRAQLEAAWKVAAE